MRGFKSKFLFFAALVIISVLHSKTLLARTFNPEEFQKLKVQRSFQKTGEETPNALKQQQNSPSASELRPTVLHPVWLLWDEKPQQPSSKTVTAPKTSAESSPEAGGESGSGSDSGSGSGSAAETSSLPRVFHPKTHNIGVITGNIKISLAHNSKDELQRVLNSYALSLVQDFSHLNTFYVRSQSEHSDLEALFLRLQSDPSITSVKAEILSRAYERK